MRIARTVSRLEQRRRRGNESLTSSGKNETRYLVSYTNLAGDGQSSLDLEHAVVQADGHVKLGFVYTDSVRLIHFQLVRGSPHAASAAFASACHTHDPVFFRQIFADDMAIGARNDDVVPGIHAKMLRLIEACFQRFSAMPSEAFASRSS